MQLLRDLDLETKSSWVDRVYGAIAEAIDQRSQDYIRRHTERDVRVGCILFDRQRKVIKKSNLAQDLLPNLC